FTLAVRRRLAALFVLLAAAIFVAWWIMVRMPGRSYRGPLPPLSAGQIALRDELRADVQRLASEIGERNLEHYDTLREAADFIEKSFAHAGCKPHRQSYDLDGKTCHNIDVELPGKTGAIVVVGAQYDSVLGSAGANDNASGVAGTLALARRF